MSAGPQTGAPASGDFPNFALDGQVALVTGAARGIGRAVSLALAHAGADIALGLRDVGSDQGLVGEIEALGRRALALQMDIGVIDEARAAVAAAEKEFGRIDILVNNAGASAGESRPRTYGRRTST